MTRKPKKDLSLPRISKLFADFYAANGFYPNGQDIDTNPMFDFTVKTIDRRFGGLRKLRNKLDLPVTDLRKTERYKKQTLNSVNLSQIEELKLYKKLKKHFGEIYVHRQAPYTDGGRCRTDFKVYHNNGFFYIDLFHPNDDKSFNGCIRAKKKKLDPYYIRGKIYLVNANSKIKTSVKTQLPENIEVITLSKLLTLMPIYVPRRKETNI